MSRATALPPSMGIVTHGPSIRQMIPIGPPELPAVGGTIEETPIRGGLHHDYGLAA